MTFKNVGSSGAELLSRRDGHRVKHVAVREQSREQCNALGFSRRV